jgi:spore coat polysaccharide biosynthesis protein SpsF (cytidylyltransferase family)
MRGHTRTALGTEAGAHTMPGEWERVMRTGAVILARMSSTRLPEKVFRELDGVALIERVLRRARLIGAADQVVIATSRDASDDAIARYGRSAGVDVFRGSLDDVSRRVLDCARFWRWGWFARVNGDSPFLDPELISAGIELAVTEDLDFVTNLAPRSYPYGVAVEVVRTEAYAAAYERMRRSEDHEHVTPYLYSHLDDYNYENIERRAGDCSGMRLTVDNEEDAVRCTALMRRLGPRSDRSSVEETIAAYHDLWPVEAPATLAAIAR